MLLLLAALFAWVKWMPLLGPRLTLAPILADATVPRVGAWIRQMPDARWRSTMSAGRAKAVTQRQLLYQSSCCEGRGSISQVVSNLAQGLDTLPPRHLVFAEQIRDTGERQGLVDSDGDALVGPPMSCVSVSPLNWFH